jgi:hypothetical protein
VRWGIRPRRGAIVALLMAGLQEQALLCELLFLVE